MRTRTKKFPLIREKAVWKSVHTMQKLQGQRDLSTQKHADLDPATKSKASRKNPSLNCNNSVDYTIPSSKKHSIIHWYPHIGVQSHPRIASVPQNKGNKAVIFTEQSNKINL
jgi:hypothetical protein